MLLSSTLTRKGEVASSSDPLRNEQHAMTLKKASPSMPGRNNQSQSASNDLPHEQLQSQVVVKTTQIPSMQSQYRQRLRPKASYSSAPQSNTSFSSLRKKFYQLFDSSSSDSPLSRNDRYYAQKETFSDSIILRNLKFIETGLSPPVEVCSHRVAASWKSELCRLYRPERYQLSLANNEIASIEMHTIHPSNLSDLKKVNDNVIPVRYQDHFYEDVVHIHHPMLSQLAYVNFMPVGAIACRKEAIGQDIPVQEYRVYIMTLGVLSSHRRHNIGSLLLQRVIQYCQTDHNVSYLGLHVQTTNKRAIQFYLKHGFYIYCRVENYYYRNANVHPPDAYFLKRDLRKNGCQRQESQVPVYKLTPKTPSPEPIEPE